MKFSLERKMSPVKGLVNIESTKAEEDYTKQRLKSRLSNTTLIQKLSSNPIPVRYWNLQFWFENSHLTQRRFFTIMVAFKNKYGIVTPIEVTKSDFAIGFSVVDLVEFKVWFMSFLLAWCFFRRLKSKSRVSVTKFSKQLKVKFQRWLFFRINQLKI